MTNVPRFVSLLQVSGSDAIFHRESGGAPCPCRTPEGYRDPKWHIDHPTEPVCNEEAFLPGTVTNVSIKGFIQPAQSAAVRRLTSEYVDAIFGEVQGDDHLGIFPLEWAGVVLDFTDWSQTGSEYVFYHSKRFLVVNANRIPDPADGQPHHWEIGLRLMTGARPT